ncbi:peptide MFS transporter [Propionimicrobium sp. PCR01-08-3]|uniref:peptide MFS transporter n=1 Tax=Propionimicrobium sp. PCR01-08-3 TaxID=3052086 RepID=UPI00255C2FCA|nr:peptide MFS transporter [Propionimicrobium sp. PCR01-08-3]WIY82215.1 peptide MFS transporter [Propionimicrobium sp. PCR01-08-3]
MSSTTSESTPASAGNDASKGHGGFFGHPWGLANLAGVELWERFSFYGMQSLLAFYIYYSVSDGGLGLSEMAATSIVGAYGGLVYLSSVLGGWIADRVLGSEKTLLSSAVSVMIGHLALAFLPGIPGLAIGLICVAVGAGSLKTTTSTTLGDLYSPGDNRRDAAFSIYYMAVNIGALIGPLGTSALWGWRGFHWGFGLAAVGMAAGLIQYIAMRHHTLSEASSKPTNPLSSKEKRNWTIGLVVVLAVLIAIIVSGLIQAEYLSTIVVVLTSIAAVVLFVVILTSKNVESDERSRVFSFIPMFIASSVFWSLFQQQFTVMAIYSDQRLNRHVFGMDLPPSVVNSINPVFIIIFAGVFAALWTTLGDRQPTAPVKFSLGTVIMGVAFLLFIPFAGGADGTVPFWAIVLILFFFTLAELCLSPVGQSLSTKLAPNAYHSQMVALYFLSVSLGSAMAGTLSSLYDTTNEIPYFLGVGGGSIVVGVVLFLARKPIVRLMRGVK